MLTVATPQRDESSETVAPVVQAAPAEFWTFTVSETPCVYMRTVPTELLPTMDATDVTLAGARSSGKMLYPVSGVVTSV